MQSFLRVTLLFHHSVFVMCGICNLLNSQFTYCCLYLSRNQTVCWFLILCFQYHKMHISCAVCLCHRLYFGIFIILFTCNITIHANHETRYFPLMKLRQTIQFGQQIGSSYFGEASYQEKNSTERVLHQKHFSFFAKKNELSTFNDRYLHCDTNRVLGLNIRYRSIYNEFR